MLVNNADKIDVERLTEMPIQVSSGRTVKLSSITTFNIEHLPGSIERRDQQYRRFIRVDFHGPVQVGENLIDHHIRTMPLAAGYRLERKQLVFFDEEVKSSFYGILIGILIIVYLITAAFFESWKLPAVVMLSVPTALIGVGLGFVWTGAYFAEGAFIGCILLTGIAVNDGILLVDRFRALKRRSPTSDQKRCIRLAICHRLRPMWTTTLTSLVAMAPLLVFPDESDFWVGFAVTVMGGLLASTLLAPVATVAFLSMQKSR